MLPTSRLAPPLFVILLGSAVAVCAQEPHPPPDATAAGLPASIHRLPLMEAIGGDTAAGNIDRLHDTAVAPVTSAMGRYGAHGMQATLYLSRYATAGDAQAALTAMVARLSEGTPEFGHYAAQRVAGTEVHRVFGLRQVHYVFLRDRELLWLAAPAALAQVGLADLLRVPPDSVPPMELPPVR